MACGHEPGTKGVGQKARVCRSSPSGQTACLGGSLPPASQPSSPKPHPRAQHWLVPLMGGLTIGLSGHSLDGAAWGEVPC